MKYIGYILLFLIVAIDAIGDGFRTQGLQDAHHIAEVAMVVGFLAVWKLSKFEWVYVPFYLLVRIWAFNPIYNLVAGNKLGYLGNSNIYDRAIIWFGEAVKTPPGNLYFILQFMALLSCVGLIIKEYRKTLYTY